MPPHQCARHRMAKKGSGFFIIDGAHRRAPLCRCITLSLNTEPEEIEYQQQRIPLIVPSVFFRLITYDGSSEASGTINVLAVGKNK
eukprot:scaffold34164_cov222-Skeletonema_dohrnii-CCMP3373.AAC.1